MELIPRWYQEEAFQSMFAYVCTPNATSTLVVLQTGLGKSLIPAEFIKRLLVIYPDLRFINATHVEELVAGNYRTFKRQYPTGDAGICHAGLKRKEYDNQTIYGGIGSMYRTPEKFGHRDILFVDEAHLISPNTNTMYGKFISALREINPKMIVIGLTATPYRLGMGLLTDGDMFDHVAYDITDMAGWARVIDEGFLCPLITRYTEHQYDLSPVASVKGDFKQKDLQALMVKNGTTETAVVEIMGAGQTRKHWLVFSSGVDHANEIRDMFREKGISAVALHGVKSKMEDGITRDIAYRDFENGKYKVLVSVGMTTTGYDFPALDLIAHLRGTKSTSLWVQMNGRGTRPHPSKKNCLVLDFVGNTSLLGAVNDPVLPKKPGEKQDNPAPVKLCENCACINHASVRFCSDCGEEFPKGLPTLLISALASKAAIMKTQTPEVVAFDVGHVTYMLNKGKRGKPASLLVTYHIANTFTRYKEWVTLEHTGYAKHLAHDWWRARSSTEDCPELISEALKQIDGLAVPSEIKVWVNRPYPEILSYNLNGEWI